MIKRAPIFLFYLFVAVILILGQKAMAAPKATIFDQFSDFMQGVFTAPGTAPGTAPETELNQESVEVILKSIESATAPSVFQETISVTIQLTPFEKPPQKEFLPFGKLQKPEAKKEAAKKFLSLGKLTKPEVKKVEPPKPVELEAAFKVFPMGREGFAQFKIDWNVKNMPAGAKVSTRIAEHHNFKEDSQAGSNIYTVGDGKFRFEEIVQDKSGETLACLEGPEEIVLPPPGAGTFAPGSCIIDANCPSGQRCISSVCTLP